MHEARYLLTYLLLLPACKAHMQVVLPLARARAPQHSRHLPGPRLARNASRSSPERDWPVQHCGHGGPNRRHRIVASRGRSLALLRRATQRRRPRPHWHLAVAPQGGEGHWTLRCGRSRHIRWRAALQRGAIRADRARPLRTHGLPRVLCAAHSCQTARLPKLRSGSVLQQAVCFSWCSCSRGRVRRACGDSREWQCGDAERRARAAPLHASAPSRSQRAISVCCRRGDAWAIRRGDARETALLGRHVQQHQPLRSARGAYGGWAARAAREPRPCQPLRSWRHWRRAVWLGPVRASWLPLQPQLRAERRRLVCGSDLATACAACHLSRRGGLRQLHDALCQSRGASRGTARQEGLLVRVPALRGAASRRCNARWLAMRCRGMRRRRRLCRKRLLRGLPHTSLAGARRTGGNRGALACRRRGERRCPAR